ncbi:MAG: class I SAM-dependent methyltransferase [Candidatus Eremiobacteraeota bacterium]|nr:class I SAM-dependent methyltransferase [Candidatus Eremiobacteraeota bacterium]
MTIQATKAGYRPFTTAWPGDDLVSRVTGNTNHDWFYETGRRSIEEIEAVLGIAQRNLGTFTSILDFGCGCGRILLWLGELAKSAAVHGVDIDSAAVHWAQHHIPYATIKVNDAMPPLDYEDGMFDLVYNHSVFSHIDEEMQNRWLEELQRVTRPGGFLVLSVHGEYAFGEFSRAREHDAAELRRRLQTHGFAFVRDDGHAGGPFPDFYHTAFHAPWYIFSHWSRWFRIRGYVPRGSLEYQDFVLLERLPDGYAIPGPFSPLTSP